jgi:hypothetical protein
VRHFTRPIRGIRARRKLRHRAEHDRDTESISAAAAAPLLNDGRLGMAVTAEQQRDTESAWAVVAAPVIDGGELRIAIITEHQSDELYFSVPDGFRTHPDLVAAAMAPLLAAHHDRISFEFPVSDVVREQIGTRTGASVSAAGAGEPRQPGKRIALNFSGGMDSLAAWLLAPHQVERVAIDFGGWFDREREFFETLSPDVTCVTNFRSKATQPTTGCTWARSRCCSRITSIWLDGIRHQLRIEHMELSPP